MWVLNLLSGLLLMMEFRSIHTSGADLCRPHPKEPFDFEDPEQKNCFEVRPVSSGTASISTEYTTVKHGAKSLKWEATAPSTLILKSNKVFIIPNDWLSRGGMKVWLYRKTSAPTRNRKLKVEFIHRIKGPAEDPVVGSFDVYLNFNGWRGIWVKFAECKRLRNSLTSARINQVSFILAEPDIIYMDILGFEPAFGKQSRDKVVPPIAPFGLSTYDASNTWQRAYKWSKQPLPPLPGTIDTHKRRSLEVIENKLRNWYCDETKTSSNDFPSGSHLENRWKMLMRNAQNSHKEYDRLALSASGTVEGPPLFCRDCRFGTTKFSTVDPTRKFGFIMESVLLPLALEFHLRSRANEVQSAAVKQLPELNSGDASRKKTAIIAMAGRDKTMQKLLTDSLFGTTTSLTQSQVKNAIEALNSKRLKKITNLLDYVEEQGFTDGSSLGCMDHELNLDGAGFINTLFLIKDSLSKRRRLELIRTAKWYIDFGEIYQSPTFEYKGTTADRMITNLFFRLIIILTMPNDNDNEVKAQIRDMEALVRWINNALAVNEGIGGVVKPDFTGYHHKAFYGSAYVPQALHTASLTQYLLSETEFSLSPSSTNNIIRGLETLRTIAVKYSTPNSVNGRFPNYSNKALIKTALPAYAYISASGSLKIRGSDLSKVQMFLRLYQDTDAVTEYLNDGKVSKGKYYLNSLGSLDIMKAVHDLAVSEHISPEPSPEGHWSKNFAVLSIHRRSDWVATMKGFNHFIWDFELSGNQNVYGIFASHGSLLVANSEEALKEHDVDNGWDWAKVPGATTIALGEPDIEDLKMTEGRFYNKKPLAGGVTFKGGQHLPNGAFGMDFQQPDYGFKNWRKNIMFSFKKSVFFFENLLVCLGSNIEAHGTDGRRVQTTIFQDKLEDGVSTSFVKVDGEIIRHSPLASEKNPSSSSGIRYTTLTDAKGNGYYIPDPSTKILKFQVKEQSSKTNDGKDDTKGRYASAWFDHSESAPSSYEYAVIIPTDLYTAGLDELKTAQETADDKFYKVLNKDSSAHVVQFLKSPSNWPAAVQLTTGYVIFEATVSLPSGGPLKQVSKECLVMAEDTSEFLYLAISLPNLDFPTAKGLPRQSDDIGQEELYHTSSRENEIEVTLGFPVEKNIVEVKVHGEPDCYKPNVWVISSPSDCDKGDKIAFLNLQNGFSVEVKLKK